MLFRRWLAQLRFYWERRKLVKEGVWGENQFTLRYLLNQLQFVTFKELNLTVAQNTHFQTRSGNVDDLLQVLRRARYCMEGDDVVVDEPMRKLANFDRTIDDYLLTVENAPIAPEEVRRVLTEELQGILNYFKDLPGRDPHRDQYYKRQLDWLLVEVRTVITALLVASDQRLKV